MLSRAYSQSKCAKDCKQGDSLQRCVHMYTVAYEDLYAWKMGCDFGHLPLCVDALRGRGGLHDSVFTAHAYKGVKMFVLYDSAGMFSIVLPYYLASIDDKQPTKLYTR